MLYVLFILCINTTFTVISKNTLTCHTLHTYTNTYTHVVMIFVSLYILSSVLVRKVLFTRKCCLCWFSDVHQWVQVQILIAQQRICVYFRLACGVYHVPLPTRKWRHKTVWKGTLYKHFYISYRVPILLHYLVKVITYERLNNYFSY